MLRLEGMVVACALLSWDVRDACADEAPVHVSVRVQREKDVADVFVERGEKWTLVCQAPCTFEATRGEQVRVAMDGILEEPLAFTVEGDDSGAQDIEVRRRGGGRLVGGLVAIGVGTASMALGEAILRGADKGDLFGAANGWIGFIGMVLGAASVVTGTVLILKRPTEPFLASPPRSQAVDPVLARPQLVWTLQF